MDDGDDDNEIVLSLSSAKTMHDGNNKSAGDAPINANTTGSVDFALCNELNDSKIQVKTMQKLVMMAKKSNVT